MDKNIRHGKKRIWRRAGLAMTARLTGAGALLSALVLGGLIYDRDWAAGKEARLRHALVTPDEHDFDMLDQLADRADNPDLDEPQLKGISSRQLRIGINPRVLVLDRHTGRNKAKVQSLVDSGRSVSGTDRLGFQG
jgi:hypothetical protein